MQRQFAVLKWYGICVLLYNLYIHCSKQLGEHFVYRVSHQCKVAWGLVWGVGCVWWSMVVVVVGLEGGGGGVEGGGWVAGGGGGGYWGGGGLGGVGGWGGCWGGLTSCEIWPFVKQFHCHRPRCNWQSVGREWNARLPPKQEWVCEERQTHFSITDSIRF